MSKSPWLSPLLFLSAFAFALLGLNPSFYMDDSPETLIAASTLGIAHPPGYPLYVIPARLFSLLPLAQIALRVNLFSGLTAALVCLLLFQVLKGRFHVNPLTAFAVSLLWIAGALAYPAALSSKMGIYQLAALGFVSILLCLLSARWRLASFLFGISLAGHWMSMAAYTPGFLLLFPRASQSAGPGARKWIEALSLILLGSSLYLFLPLRGALDPLMNWGYPVHFTDFHHHLSRYVDTNRDFALSAGLWFSQLGHYLKSCYSEFPGLGLLSLLGLWALGRRDRWTAAAIGLSWAGLVGAVCVFSKLSHEKIYLLDDYSISSMFLLLLAAGLGLGAAHSWLEARGKARYFGALVLAFSLILMTYRYFHGRQTHYTYTYDYAANVLRGLPRGGMLLCRGDVLEFPLWYLQMIEGKRRDVAVLGAGSLPMDWYRIHLAKEHPDLKIPFPSHERDKVYISGKIFLWMLQNNPKSDYAFTYAPMPEDGFSTLPISPYGLTLQDSPSNSQKKWDEAKARWLWRNVRLRHFVEDRSLDSRSWDYFLRDYAMARSWTGLYEMNLAGEEEKRSKDPKAADAFYRMSLGHFVWAATWDSRNPLFPFNAGKVLYRLGDFKNGLEWMQKTTLLDPGNPEAFYIGGLMASRTGDRAMAEMLFQRTLALRPGHAGATEALRELTLRPSK